MPPSNVNVNGTSQPDELKYMGVHSISLITKKLLLTPRHKSVKLWFIHMNMLNTGYIFGSIICLIILGVICTCAYIYIIYIYIYICTRACLYAHTYICIYPTIKNITNIEQ